MPIPTVTKQSAPSGSRIAYFPAFWYSAFLNLNVDSFHFHFAATVRARAISHLKLLSLLFDKIYIPRTHFFNHFSSMPQEIIVSVFKDEFIASLVERGILVTSRSSWLDGYSETELIKDVFSQYAWLTRELDTPIGKIVDGMQTIDIDNEAEARNNIQLFNQLYAGYDNPSFKNTYTNIVERSSDNFFGFFHEQFILDLKKELPDPLFGAVWKATNSTYLITGAPNRSDVFPIFIPTIEHSESYSHSGFLRPLYSPVGIDIFFGLLAKSRSLSNFLNADAQVIIQFVHNHDANQMFANFRSAYFAMCRELSRFITMFRPAAGVDPTVLRSIIEAYMAGSLDRALGDSITTVATGAEKAASLADPVTGIAVSTVLGLTRRFLTDHVARMVARKRHPALYGVIDAIDRNFAGSNVD